MEKTLVVVLLLCARSSATETQSEKQAQSYSSELHNELVDIRVKLAQDRLMIEQLQKEKEELKSKVKELENLDSHLKSIKTQLEAQASELRSLKTQSNETKDQVETMKRDKEVEQVAFSAVLRSREVTLGPYSAHTPLAFTHVLTNIGNAYNSHTGIFTAPVRGAYHFEFYNAGAGGQTTAVVLVKNGEHVVADHENQGTGFGTAANGASLLLEVGDVVMLHLYEGNTIFDNKNRHSTFSGRLLFTM